MFMHFVSLKNSHFLFISFLFWIIDFIQNTMTERVTPKSGIETEDEVIGVEEEEEAGGTTEITGQMLQDGNEAGAVEVQEGDRPGQTIVLLVPGQD